LRIDEVEETRETIQKDIEHLTEVNREVLNEYMINPIKSDHNDQDFIKRTEKQLKLEVTTKICDGEQDLEKMQLIKIEKIMEDYALWK
jgi:hypothetical protein